METESNRSALRSRRKERIPAKQVTPPKVKKSASVAGIFKQPLRKVQHDTIVHQTAREPLLTNSAQHVLDEKAQSLKARSNSQSPRNPAARVTKRKSDQHLLAVAFKETSDDYRRHLYKTASQKISITLSTLLHNLYENSLQVVSSDTNNSQLSPLRLTIPAKLEREALKIYQSISAYKIGLTRTNTDGTKTKFSATLRTRMTDYAEWIAVQKADIAKLKEEWEVIVGEIWKVGVQVLGEETMESMLFTNKQRAQEISLSPTEAESTIFVPEQGTSPPRRVARGKKRVTFVEDGDEEVQLREDRMSGPLWFLYQPTRLRVGPVPSSPALPKVEIEDVEMKVKKLGQKELEEWKKAEKDYKLFWQRKNAALAQILASD